MDILANKIWPERMIAATKYRAINLQESIHVPCRRRHVLCPALCTQLIQTFHLSLFVSYFNNLKIAYVLQEMFRLLVVLLLRPTYCTAWDTGGAGWKADPTRPQESQTNAVVCGSSSLEYEYVPSPAFFFYHSCWQFCVCSVLTYCLHCNPWNTGQLKGATWTRATVVPGRGLEHGTISQ